MKPDLEIKFCTDNQDVTIKMNKQDEFVWNEISNIFLDSKEILYDIKVRFHDFFRNIEDVKYVINKNNISMYIDEEVEKAIKKSQNNIVPEHIKRTSIDLINSVLDNTPFSRNLKKYQKNNLQEIMNIKGVALFSVPGSGKNNRSACLLLLS